MNEYLGLVRKVLFSGKIKQNRTGQPTLCCFGQTLNIPLDTGLPILTTKQMPFKSILAELLWLISGENHPRNLQIHTKIWNPWIKKGELDSIYGFYWRNFPSVGGGKMIPNLSSIDLEGLKPRIGNIDQLAWLINELRVNPNSRRLLVSAVEPANFQISLLPPCHDSFVFNVLENKLNLQVRMRSVDLGIGLPFNITSYALLANLIGKEVGISLGTLQFTMVDCHIYLNHQAGLLEQVKREPFFLPEIELPKKSILSLDLTDIASFRLFHYQCHEAIRLPIAI
jgi:thymidylate synthase